MTLAHAILASVELQHITGHDLKKFFDRSVGHCWTTTQSHVYKALTDLEKEGWAQKNIVKQEDKPNHKQCSITKTRHADLRGRMTAASSAHIHWSN